MKIALISDIHGNLPALDAVLADIARVGVDITANLGDIVSGPLWPAQTADRLMALGLPTIAGNHERQVLSDNPARHGESDAWAAPRLAAHHRQWLRSLPGTLWLAPGVYACHGTPGSDLHYWLETVTPDYGQHGSPGVRAATAEEAWARARGTPAAGAALAVCGHSHVARMASLPGGPLVLNPGSVGLPGYDDTHPHRHRVQAGTPHARYALATLTAAGWQAELRAIAYDHHSAARQAMANGRADWACAISTGWMPGEAAHNPNP